MSKTFLDADEIAGPREPFHEELARWQKLPTAHLRNLVLPQDHDACRAAEHHSESNGAGIYALFDSLDRLMYIGMSLNLSARLHSHWQAARYGREPRYAMYSCMTLPAYAARDVEIAHIHALQPDWNRLYELPRWNRHKAMMATVLDEWSLETVE